MVVRLMGDAASFLSGIQVKETDAPQTYHTGETVTPDHNADAPSDADDRSALDKFIGRKPRARGDKDMAAKPPRARTIKPDPPYRKGQYIEPLESFYNMLGIVTLPFAPNVGVAFQENAGKCAEALDEAAEKSPGLRRFLNTLTTGGTWGKVAIAHYPIAMAIVAETPLMQRAQRLMEERIEMANGHRR
jgi:hypothetical protein